MSAANWEQHIPVARRIAYRVCCRHESLMEHLEDAQQAAIVALWQCSRKYEPTHGTTLLQYAGTFMFGAAVDALRKAGVVHKHHRVHMVALDTPIDDEGRTLEDILPSKDDHTERNLLVKELIDLCDYPDPRRREVLIRHFLGEEQFEDIAPDWRVKGSRVGQICDHAIRIVRTKMYGRSKRAPGNVRRS